MEEVSVVLVGFICRKLLSELNMRVSQKCVCMRPYLVSTAPDGSVRCSADSGDAADFSNDPIPGKYQSNNADTYDNSVMLSGWIIELTFTKQTMKPSILFNYLYSI